MKSLKTIQTLSKIGKILSQIVFVFSIIGFCGCIAGLLGIGFGNGAFVKLGGVTLHGLISEEYGGNVKSIFATLSGLLIVIAGEAVLAGFAKLYFQNELNAGTPFTLSGAGELFRLGILTLAISVGCAVIGRIVREIVAGLMQAEETAAAEPYFDTTASIVLGAMFMVISLLCRYGAEIVHNDDA